MAQAAGPSQTHSRIGEDGKAEGAGHDHHTGHLFETLPQVVEPPPHPPNSRMTRPAKLRMTTSSTHYRPQSSTSTLKSCLARPSTTSYTHRCAKRSCLCGLPEPGEILEEQPDMQKNVRMVSIMSQKNSLRKSYSKLNFGSDGGTPESLPAGLTEKKHRGTGYLNRGGSVSLKPRLAMMRLRHAIKTDADNPHPVSEEPTELKLPPAVGAGAGGKHAHPVHRMSVQHETHFPKLPEDSDPAAQRIHAHLHRSNSLIEAGSRQESRLSSHESRLPSHEVRQSSHESNPDRSPRNSASDASQGGRSRAATVEDDAEDTEAASQLEDEIKEEDEEDEDNPDAESSFARQWHKRMTLKERNNNMPAVSKIPLEERMQKLERLRQVKVQQTRTERMNEIKRKKFDALPHEEAESLRRAFEQFDTDHNGFLDRDEAIACLKELGIWGRTPHERHEILEMCTEASSWIKTTPFDVDTSMRLSVDGAHEFNLSLHDFALSVVPRVRQKLIDMRSTDMLKEFFKYDDDQNGKLSKQDATEVARCMGIDKRIINVAELLKQEGGGREGNMVDFEKFQVLIAKGKEQLDRLVRMRERAVQHQHGLPEELFQDLREDIIAMHQLFLCYDVDDSGSLSMTEIHYMLKELGLMPKSAKDREEVSRLLAASDVDGNGEFNFTEFLELVKEIRAFWTNKKREEHLHHFEKYDRDKKGMLSIADISALLADLGFAPKNRREQDELAISIKSVDQDDSGFITFAQLQHIAQRVNEKLKIVRYEEELDIAVQLGFTEKQMRDLRFVFDSLDVDGSGKLDLNEVRNAFTMLRKHPAQESLEASFKALDTDHSGELDFKEYLFLMQMMRDGEGIFADEQQRLALKVKMLDGRVLRRCLDYFKLSREYLNSLSKEELVSLFCDYMGVTENANLQEVLGTGTIGELYKLAETKGEAAEPGFM